MSILIAVLMAFFAMMLFINLVTDFLTLSDTRFFVIALAIATIVNAAHHIITHLYGVPL
ncbi:hypothetical protein VPHD484_0211 [Vibrio phage D484]